MGEMGKAMMGTGEADGEDRAMRAAEAAISNPLLEDTNMKGARGLLINITGGSDITLFEMDQAANRIREEVDEDANIMVGMALDESLQGRMRISVVATGIDSSAPAVSQMPKFQVVGGGVVDAVAFPPQAHTQNAPAVAQAAPPAAFAPAPSGQGAGYIPQPPAKPLISAAYAAPADDEAEMKPARPAANAVPPSLRPGMEPKRPTLFSRVFGGGAPAAPAPAPAAPARAVHREPTVAPVAARQEPEFHPPVQEAPRAAVRPAQIDEIGLEIPAFLRRSQ
jgi:cell division protein FtsZ